MEFINTLKHIRGIILSGLLISCSCGLIFGLVIGLNTPINKSLFLGENESVILKKSIVTSSSYLGAFFGSPISGYVADNWGRKKALWICVVIMAISNIFTIASSGSLYIMCAVGKFMFGIGLGGISSIGPLYMNETSPEKLRGFLGVFFQVSITASIFIAALTLFANGAEVYRVLFAILYIPIIMLAAVLYVAKESPRYLAKKNPAKAKEYFKEIYKNDEQVNNEVDKIQMEKKASIKEVFTSENVKPLMIGIVLAAAQQLTGINVVFNYFGEISGGLFHGSSEAEKEKLVALCYSLVNLFNMLSALFSVPLIKKFGRRTLLIIGQTIMMVSLSLTALSMFIPSAQTILRPVVQMLGICVFIFGFEISVGPLFFVVVGEISAEKVRGVLSSIMVGVQWMFNFILSASFLSIKNKINEATTSEDAVEDAVNAVKDGTYHFWIFAGVGGICLLFQIFFLPETRNKSFDEIQKEFKKGATYLTNRKENDIKAEI